MKVLILFFSGTGNTKIAAQVIAELAAQRGHQAEMRSLEDQNPFQTIDDFDIVGFFFPVYAWRPPNFVLEILKTTLPQVDKKPAFIVNTKAIADWNANRYLRSIIEDRGFVTVLSESITAPPNDWMVLFKEDHSLVKKYVKWGEDAWARMEDISKAIENPSRESPKQKGAIAAIASGFLSRPGMWLLGLATRGLSVGRDNCTSCGLCMKECPSDNILSDSEGKPVWGNECIVCFRCINRCPQKAILITALSKGKYRYRLNISPGRGDQRILPRILDNSSIEKGF